MLEKDFVALDVLLVLPSWVIGPLDGECRDQSFGVFQAGRFKHRLERSRYGGQVRQRLPAQFGNFADRLRPELRRGHQKKRIYAGGLQCHDLGIDRRIGGLISQFLDDERGHLVAKAILQATHVIPARIVVLGEYAEPSVRLVGQQILSEDLTFQPVGRIEKCRIGKGLRIVPLGGARRDKDLRDFF